MNGSSLGCHARPSISIVGDKGEKDRSHEDTHPPARASKRHADQQAQREEDREAVRGDEVSQARVDCAGRTNRGSTGREGVRSPLADVDADGQGGCRMVAQGDLGKTHRFIEQSAQHAVNQCGPGSRQEQVPRIGLQELDA